MYRYIIKPYLNEKIPTYEEFVFERSISIPDIDLQMIIKAVDQVNVLSNRDRSNLKRRRRVEEIISKNRNAIINALEVAKEELEWDNEIIDYMIDDLKRFDPVKDEIHYTEIDY